MENRTWQLQEAKNKFSELVEQAISWGVQIVTRHGKKTVVVMPYEMYEQLVTTKGSLVEFLLDSPLSGSNLHIERDKSLPREIGIET